MMTKSEIILQMRRVSDAMIALSWEMRECGIDCCDNIWHDKGVELFDAGIMLSEWQSAAEKEENS